MINKVVKYHNDLNTIPMRNWTKEEMDFFFSIISNLKEKGTREIELNKYQLTELARYTVTHNKRFEETMERLIKNISQIYYIEKTSNSLELMNLFSKFKVNWSNDLNSMSLQVKVTEEFNYVINKLKVEFTSWELEEFTSIRSTYAKTMYRLLKQWKTIGRYECKKESFKRLLDMPEYYTPSEIDKNVLNPIKKELPGYFKNLKIKKIKSNKRGNPVIAYEFTWIPEKTGKWDPYKYNYRNGKKLGIEPDWLKQEKQDSSINKEKRNINIEDQDEETQKAIDEFHKKLKEYKDR